MSSSYRKVLLGSGSSVNGWILEYDPAFTNTSGIHNKGVSQVRAADDTDDGNMFFGVCAADGVNGAIFVKFNKDGDVLAETKLADPTTSKATSNFCMDVDSSDNVFISDRQAGKVCITKLNSSLVLQQVKTYLIANLGPDSNIPIACRGTDLYVAMNISGLTTSQRNNAMKVNTSNLSVVTSPRVLTGAGEGPQCVHIDSNGQAYVGGEFRGSISGFAFSPVNVNMSTDFTRTTNQINGQTVQGGKCYDITTDSSNNIYVAGYQQSNATTTSKNTYMKFNSTGTLQWSKVFNCPSNPGFFGINGNTSENGNSIHITDAGLVSVYYGNSNSTGEIFISLWNPSTGSIITSLKVTNTTNSWGKSPVRTGGHVFTTEEHVYVQAIADNKVYILKLPITNINTVFGSHTIGGDTITIQAGGCSTTTLTHTFDAQGAGNGTNNSLSSQNETFFATTAVSKNTNLIEL